jgi:hypothetical protein
VDPAALGNVFLHFGVPVGTAYVTCVLLMIGSDGKETQCNQNIR